MISQYFSFQFLFFTKLFVVDDFSPCFCHNNFFLHLQPLCFIFYLLAFFSSASFTFTFILSELEPPELSKFELLFDDLLECFFVFDKTFEHLSFSFVYLISHPRPSIYLDILFALFMCCYNFANFATATSFFLEKKQAFNGTSFSQKSGTQYLNLSLLILIIHLEQFVFFSL